jgi:hypothetical protein
LPSVGEISEKYEVMITPAGFAFGIWGTIYAGLLVFLLFQWYTAFRKDEYFPSAGPWFWLANALNALWIIFWSNEVLWLSVVIILLLLIALIKLVYRFRLEMYDAPLTVITFVWWPLLLYFAWVLIAVILNISIALHYTTAIGDTLSPSLWSIIILSVAAIIFLLLVFKRNMREGTAVYIWALFGISKNGLVSEAVQTSCWILMGICLLVSAWHAYINRHTSPFAKLKRGEWW